MSAEKITNQIAEINYQLEAGKVNMTEQARNMLLGMKHALQWSIADTGEPLLKRHANYLGYVGKKFGSL